LLRLKIVLRFTLAAYLSPRFRDELEGLAVIDPGLLREVLSLVETLEDNLARLSLVPPKR